MGTSKPVLVVIAREPPGNARINTAVVIVGSGQCVFLTPPQLSSPLR